MLKKHLHKPLLPAQNYSRSCMQKHRLSDDFCNKNLQKTSDPYRCLSRSYIQLTFDSPELLMLLSITHIDILFKIPTNKLITRNYNTFCNLYLYKTNIIEPFNLVKATKIQI